MLRKTGTLIKVLGVSIALAGCVANQQTASLQASSQEALSALPKHRAGDSYTFLFNGSRPQTHRVVRVEGDKVYWRVGSGRNTIQYANFLVPELEYETRTLRARIKPLVSAGYLFPLRPNTSDWMRAEINLVNKQDGSDKTYRMNYKCIVNNPETIAVPAGTFDTMKVTCDRYSNSGATQYYSTTYWYAPKIDYYVKFQRRYHGRTVRDDINMELQKFERGGQQVASMARNMAGNQRVGPAGRPRINPGVRTASFLDQLPEMARPHGERIMQLALETQLDGLSVGTTLPDGQSGVSVKPVSSLRRPDGVICRTFEATTVVNTQTSVANGTACRLDGKWVLQ